MAPRANQETVGVLATSPTSQAAPWRSPTAIGVISGAVLVLVAAGLTRVTQHDFLMPLMVALAYSNGAILWVLLATRIAMPVSTTHVSSGAIIGIGLRNGVRSVNWKVIRDMTLAWIVTLPAAGLLGVVAYLLLRLVHDG